MYLQALMDGMSAKWQRERAETQMTLGELIAALEAIPPSAMVANLDNKHSYRGYYSDLAFELLDGTRPAAELLKDCKEAMGQVFQGYKGGEFVMGSLTPLWVANYGCSGRKIMSFLEDGGIETQEDD